MKKNTKINFRRSVRGSPDVGKKKNYKTLSNLKSFYQIDGTNAYDDFEDKLAHAVSLGVV